VTGSIAPTSYVALINKVDAVPISKPRKKTGICHSSFFIFSFVEIINMKKVALSNEVLV
jgi:hypothetical protein